MYERQWLSLTIETAKIEKNYITLQPMAILLLGNITLVTFTARRHAVAVLIWPSVCLYVSVKIGCSISVLPC